METEDARRLLAADPSLFVGPTAPRALGWLREPRRYLDSWLDVTAERFAARHARVVLLGMGGSSAPARVVAEAAGVGLEVLDTTNPDTVAGFDFSGATVVASSKSGTTIETQVLLAHALAHGLEPEDLVVVTDPATALAELGASLGAVVVEGDPETGGRFSARTPFGLVPALLAGATPTRLRDVFEREADVALVERADELATAMTESGRVGLGAEPTESAGALWLDQLVAESTGKDGRGVVPVVGGSALPTAHEVDLWHLAAVLAARRLGVDPFDQPDVEGAKRGVLSLLSLADLGESQSTPLEGGDVDLDGRGYVALQVYAPLEAASEVSRLRQRLSVEGRTVTANLGPRYLHSTGQLHKGGPSEVLAVQVRVRPRTAPVRIAGRRYSFHDLHHAQAVADERATRALGREVVVLEVEDLDEAAIRLGAS